MMKQYYSTIQHFDIVYVCCTGHGCRFFLQTNAATNQIKWISNGFHTISPSTNAKFAINNWHRMNNRGGYVFRITFW